MPNPNEMEIPKSPSNYTKIEEGTIRLRILSTDFIEGYTDYDPSDKKSIKYRKDACPEKAINPDWFIYFRSCIVRNYNAVKKEDGTFIWMLQIFDIKSKQIMGAIRSLMNDPERWPKLDYDIKITKVWDKKNAKYTLQAAPTGKGKLDKDIMEAYKAADLQLESLFGWIDPFKK